MSTWEYMTKCDYQLWDTWLSMNISIVTHNQVRVSTWVSINKCKYQHLSHDCMRISIEVYITQWECNYGNIWLRVNIKMGTHDQVKIEIHLSMTKHKYQLWDTWPSEIPTLVYMTKSEYQNRDTWPSEKRNTGIHDQVWISTVWYKN